MLQTVTAAWDRFSTEENIQITGRCLVIGCALLAIVGIGTSLVVTRQHPNSIAGRAIPGIVGGLSFSVVPFACYMSIYEDNVRRNNAVVIYPKVVLNAIFMAPPILN